MKYRVLRNCFGFQNRYWERDSIVDIDPLSKPPAHFHPMEVEATEEIEAPVEETIPEEPQVPDWVAPKAEAKPKKKSKKR